MSEHLYAIWLGDVLFCFSGETSEPKVDAWTRKARRLEGAGGRQPFAGAALRLAEVRHRTPAAAAGDGRPARRSVAARTLEGLALAPEDAFELLLGADEGDFRRSGLEPGPELAYWAGVARFTLELLASGRISPAVLAPKAETGRRRGGEQAASAGWTPSFGNGDDREGFRLVAVSLPELAWSVRLNGPGGTAPAGREAAAAAVLLSFMQALISAEMKRATAEAEPELAGYRADYRRGYSSIAELWWNALLAGSRELPVQGSPAELQELRSGVAEAGQAEPPLIETAESGLGELALGLRLEPPEGEEDEAWRLTFWAEGRQDGGFWRPAAHIWASREDGFTLWGREYRDVRRQLLTALGQAAEVCGDIGRALLTPAPDSVQLTPEQLYRLLKEDVPLLTKRGVTVQLPSRWSREGRRRAGARLKMEPGESPEGVSGGAGLGMEQLVTFSVEASLGGMAVTAEELQALLAEDVPYIFFRGEWIEIDPKEIRQVLRYIKRREGGEMTASEWLRLAAQDGEDRLWKGLSVSGMETAGPLAAMLRGEAPRVQQRDVPEELIGTLRPYQERGYRWMSAMLALGFGVCLADDMGLGKTVQVITCLLDLKRDNSRSRESGPFLILCPTSLLGNWQRELQRFAPSLSLYIHHGTRRARGDTFAASAVECDIVLTTYHLAGRDYADLERVPWSAAVLDEAQYIKNHRTKQAQSVKRLSAPKRIAMTGTPVENRLGELWSIFHFLNPGYLGSYYHFRQRFALGEGQERLGELHKLAAPFLLRRLKSDPDISRDLPEKLELKQYCALTEEQAVLYRGVVDQMLGTLEGSEGMARRGLVLSSLTRLKQICDHPQLLRGGESGRGAKAESGKLEVLFELLDGISEMGESALIFTQYVGMGELLVKKLGKRYGREPLFLHGGVPKKERDDMVASFQEGEEAGFFVLSLKAGGVGLNLTKANHVIHYDRWWNPAVENQATDRAFRIGQSKNVQVHKLICQGTLEERIDELIDRKKSLSEQVVGSGETWLTEMSDNELKELIELQSQERM